jgi:hypothetical protein
VKAHFFTSQASYPLFADENPALRIAKALRNKFGLQNKTRSDEIRTTITYGCILTAHAHTQRVEVQSELPLSVNAVFEQL